MLLDVRPNCINWNIFSEISWGWGGGRSCSGALCRNLCLYKVPELLGGLLEWQAGGTYALACSGGGGAHPTPAALAAPPHSSTDLPLRPGDVFVSAICSAVRALGLQRTTSSVVC